MAMEGPSRQDATTILAQYDKAVRHEPRSVNIMDKEVPRVSLPILWWLQARTRAYVLERRLRTVCRKHGEQCGGLRLATPPGSPERKAEPARDDEAKLRAALRDADSRLDELRQGALSALSSAEERLAAKEAKLAEVSSKLEGREASRGAERESRKKFAELRLAAALKRRDAAARAAALAAVDGALAAAAASAAERPAAPAAPETEAMAPLAPHAADASFLASLKASVEASCAGKLAAALATHDARSRAAVAALLAARDGEVAFALAAAAEGAAVEGAAGLGARRRQLEAEFAAKVAAVEEEQAASRRAADVEVAALRTAHARAVDALRSERRERQRKDDDRDGALRAAFDATRADADRLARRAAKEADDLAFARHAAALEDAMRSQSARHATALADALRACDARHASINADRRRRDAQLAATLKAALPPRAKHDARRAKPATKKDLDPRPPPALDLGDGRPVVVVADRARDSLRRAVAAVDDLYASETQPRTDEPRKITPDKEKEGPPTADARRPAGREAEPPRTADARRPKGRSHWPPPPPSSRPKIPKLPPRRRTPCTAPPSAWNSNVRVK